MPRAGVARYGKTGAYNGIYDPTTKLFDSNYYQLYLLVQCKCF